MTKLGRKWSFATLVIKVEYADKTDIATRQTNGCFWTPANAAKDSMAGRLIFAAAQHRNVRNLKADLQKVKTRSLGLGRTRILRCP